MTPNADRPSKWRYFPRGRLRVAVVCEGCGASSLEPSTWAWRFRRTRTGVPHVRCRRCTPAVPSAGTVVPGTGLGTFTRAR